RIVGNCIDASVNDRDLELRIFGARTFAATSEHDEETAIDLLPPVHASGILLADEAAFGEADPVQLGGVALEPEKIAEFRLAFGNAQAQPMFEPAERGLVRRAEPAVAELGQPRVGHSLVAVSRPMHR